MTLRELVQLQGDIESLCVRLREVTRPASEAMSALESHAVKVTKDDICRLRQALFVEQATLNEAREMLIGYSALLDGIMRATDVEWPPKCSSGPTTT